MEVKDKLRGETLCQRDSPRYTEAWCIGGCLVLDGYPIGGLLLGRESLGAGGA